MTKFNSVEAITSDPYLIMLANLVGTNYGGLTNQYATNYNYNDPKHYLYNDYSGENDFPYILNMSMVPFNRRDKLQQLNSALINKWVIFHKIPQSVVDEWNRLQLAGADANQQKTFWQKVKEAATNTFSTVSTGVNNVLEDAKNLGKSLGDKLTTFLNNAPQNVAFAPLLPFVPAMRNQLNKRGFSVSGLGILDISKMFLENVIQSKSNYQYANLDPATAAAFASSPEGKDMIKQILDFFLSLANKPTLSSNDKEMLKDAEGGLDDILTPSKVDASGFTKYILIALGIFLAYKFFNR